MLFSLGFFVIVLIFSWEQIHTQWESKIFFWIKRKSEKQIYWSLVEHFSIGLFKVWSSLQSNALHDLMMTFGPEKKYGSNINSSWCYSVKEKFNGTDKLLQRTNKTEKFTVKTIINSVCFCSYNRFMELFFCIYFADYVDISLVWLFEYFL